MKKISNILNTVYPAKEEVKDRRPRENGVQQLTCEYWRRVMEPAIFDHTRVTAFNDGTWAVFCDAGVWASRVREQTPSILKRLADQGVEVTELRIHVQPRTKESD